MPLTLPPWPPEWPDIEASVISCIRSGQWGRYHSQACEDLRRQLAERFQADHVRLCCSGSAAIEIALRACGVQAGDEVIVSAYDYPGNFRSIELVGARPVLVDVVGNSACLECEQLEAASGERVKAVIASHLFGVAAKISRLRAICDQRGWVLIEDACQVPGMRIGSAFESPRDDQPRGNTDHQPRTIAAAGATGHFGAISFGGSKPLTAGTGGALLTSDPKLAARLGPLLDRPSDVMPLSPLQAAVLPAQLRRLNQTNRRRFETVRFLESEVIPELHRWQWLSANPAEVTPAYYKVAWAAEDAAQRARVIAAAEGLGLPMGEGFHAMTRSSDRRCRKPVPLPHAARLAETLFVLDHTALLIEPSDRPKLRELLIELHQSSCG